MRPFASTLALATTLKAHFIGLYYSIVLPTSAAQNVIRAFILAKSIDYSVSWASSWISGVLGLLTLAVLSTYGLIHIEHSTLPPVFSNRLCPHTLSCSFWLFFHSQSGSQGYFVSFLETSAPSLPRGN